MCDQTICIISVTIIFTNLSKIYFEAEKTMFLLKKI